MDERDRLAADPLPVGADDRYGVVLLAILGSLVLMGLLPSTPLGRFVLVLVLSVVLLLVYRVSHVRGAVLGVATVLVAVGAVAAAAALFGPLDPATADGIARAIVLAYVAAGPYVVARRLLQHERITKATVAGALSLYLLLGESFAALYPLIAALTGAPFFVQGAPTSAVTYLYFSFVTMTTVGYGDFTAASDIGRICAATEALLGQTYLVTVVAVVVGNLGLTRDMRSGTER